MREGLVCQSGSWAKQFELDGQSINYASNDFVNCGSLFSGYPTRCTQYVVSTLKPMAIIASVYGQAPNFSGALGMTPDDVIAAIIINGVICGTNRFPAQYGYTGMASVSCSKWLPSGDHTILLALTGSTNFIHRSGVIITGGVLVF